MGGHVKWELRASHAAGVSLADQHEEEEGRVRIRPALLGRRGGERGGALTMPIANAAR